MNDSKHLRPDATEQGVKWLPTPLANGATAWPDFHEARDWAGAALKGHPAWLVEDSERYDGSPCFLVRIRPGGPYVRRIFWPT